MDYKRLKEVTRGYMSLQGVARDNKRLQETQGITRGYKG